MNNRLGGGRSILLSYRNIPCAAAITAHRLYIIILTIMRFVKFYLKNLSPNPSKSRCLIRRLIKYHIALHPNLPLKPSSNRRLSGQILLGDPHMENDVAAFQ